MAAGGVLHRVGEHLLHHQLQPLLVRQHPQARLPQIQRHPASDEERGILPGRLAEHGVQGGHADEVVGGGALQPEIAEHQLHIPLNTEQLRGQLPAPRALILLEQQAHGGDGGLDLVDPHGVVVHALPQPGVQGGDRRPALLVEL